MNTKTTPAGFIKIGLVGGLAIIAVLCLSLGSVKPAKADSSFSFSISTDNFHVGYRSVDGGGYRYWHPGGYDRYHDWQDGYFSGPVVYAPDYSNGCNQYNGGYYSPGYAYGGYSNGAYYNQGYAYGGNYNGGYRYPDNDHDFYRNGRSGGSDYGHGSYGWNGQSHDNGGGYHNQIQGQGGGWGGQDRTSGGGNGQGNSYRNDNRNGWSGSR